MSSPQRAADYDQTLKRMLTEAHDGFLALLVPGAQWIGERSPELPANPRQADLVWEVALANGERLLLHVELQTKADPLIGERLAEYAIRLWRRDHLPVRSIVVYLREPGSVAEPPFSIGRGGGEEGLRYRYDVVRLWRVPMDQVLATPHVGLWPLTPLMAGATLDSTAEAAEQIARTALPRAERSELAALLATLAGMRFPRDMVSTLLRSNQMIRDILEDNSFAELLREEGEERGKREMAPVIVEMAVAILESRFGQLRADELAALRAADEPLLRSLATHVATDSREQLRVFLGLPPLAE